MNDSPASLIGQPLPRRRDERFVRALVREINEKGGLCTEAMIAAAMDVFEFGRRVSTEEQERKLALRKARQKLRRGDIRERIAGVFDQRGFSVVDAVDMHIAHMRGTAPGADGKASYQALKDFEKMTLPEAPKAPNVNQNLNVNLNAKEMFERNEAPPMRARVLGKPPKAIEQ